MLASDTQARLAQGARRRVAPGAARHALSAGRGADLRHRGEVHDALDASAAELRSLLRPLEDDLDDSARVAAAFFQALAEIHRQLLIDATAIERVTRRPKASTR